MIRLQLANAERKNKLWVDLPLEDFAETMEELDIEGDEDWYITDYETDIEGLDISSRDSIEELSELASMTEEMTTRERAVVGRYITIGESWEDAVSMVVNGRY